MAAVHRIMGNHRNDLLAATITSTGVKSSTDIRLVATTQTGNATVGLTGPYTGAANAVVDVEILNTLTDTIPRVSAPSFAGAGNGVLTTGAITSGSLAQTLTIKLTDTGVLTVNAALNFDEVVLQAKAIGDAGNGIQFTIDRTALVFTDTAYSLINDIEAGKEMLEGPEFEWSTVAARSDGTIPDTLPFTCQTSLPNAALGNSLLEIAQQVACTNSVAAVAPMVISTTPVAYFDPVPVVGRA
jgi:hypothetical protein